MVGAWLVLGCFPPALGQFQGPAPVYGFGHSLLPGGAVPPVHQPQPQGVYVGQPSQQSIVVSGVPIQIPHGSNLEININVDGASTSPMDTPAHAKSAATSHVTEAVMGQQTKSAVSSHFTEAVTRAQQMMKQAHGRHKRAFKSSASNVAPPDFPDLPPAAAVAHNLNLQDFFDAFVLEGAGVEAALSIDETSWSYTPTTERYTPPGIPLPPPSLPPFRASVDALFDLKKVGDQDTLMRNKLEAALSAGIAEQRAQLEDALGMKLKDGASIAFDAEYAFGSDGVVHWKVSANLDAQIQDPYFEDGEVTEGKGKFKFHGSLTEDGVDVKLSADNLLELPHQVSRKDHKVVAKFEASKPAVGVPV